MSLATLALPPFIFVLSLALLNVFLPPPGNGIRYLASNLSLLLSKRSEQRHPFSPLSLSLLTFDAFFFPEVPGSGKIIALNLTFSPLVSESPPFCLEIPSPSVRPSGFFLSDPPRTRSHDVEQIQNKLPVELFFCFPHF